MSLTLLWIGSAFAARVYWTSPPDPASLEAVARTVPDAVSAPLAALTTGGTEADDGAAIQRLREELAETRPLLDAFDGELAIMARLQKAAADVRVLNDTAERDLLAQALVLEGYAVHRYFQDKLGTESAAAAYRVGEGAAARVAPWMDAAALFGAPPPDARQLPEAEVRLAYDAVQAESRAMPGATVVLGPMAIGAVVRVDGVRIDGAGPGDRVGVVPGRHLVDVRVGDTVLLAVDARLKPGSDARIAAPFGPAELQVLASLVGTRAGGWEVPAAAMTPIQGAGEPVYAAVPGGEGTALLRLDGGRAQAVRIAPRRRAEGDGGGLSVAVGAGAGWLSTGDFLLLNGADGAPETKATVNAAAPTATVGARWRRGLFSAGAGVDAQLATGHWHSLPSGDSTVRTFVYPHAAVGVPWLELTAGPLFPWYAGLGARARLPLTGPLEIQAAGVYGIGVPLSRGDDPAYEPLPFFTAWAGAALRFGG